MNRVSLVFVIVCVLFQGYYIDCKRPRCNSKDIQTGKCNGNYGAKTTKPTSTDKKDDSAKEPFLIIAEDYEDEDPNDLKDAESVHGNRKPYRGTPFQFNQNTQDDENRRLYSLNNDRNNRNKRRGKSRKPFVIQVPDDNDYNYNDDYYKDFKDEDYKDDLKKDESSYLSDPFLFDVDRSINRDLVQPEYDHSLVRGARRSNWREQIRRQAARDRAFQRRDISRQRDFQHKQDEADKQRWIQELQRQQLEINVQVEQQRRNDEAVRREDEQRLREDQLQLQKDAQEMFVDLQKNQYVHTKGGGGGRRTAAYEEEYENYDAYDGYDNDNDYN